MDVKLGGTERKLAEVKILNLAQANEIAELKAALEACENKWYNADFADVENSVEPNLLPITVTWVQRWMDGCSASVGVFDDSPLRNPKQIPYSEPPSPVLNLTGIKKEENAPSMRELVQEIDSYMELVDLKITSNLSVVPNLTQSQLPDSIAQPSMEMTLIQPDQPHDPTA